MNRYQKTRKKIIQKFINSEKQNNKLVFNEKELRTFFKKEQEALFMKSKIFYDFIELIQELKLLEYILLEVYNEKKLFYINKKFNKLPDITKTFHCLAILYPKGYVSYKTAIDYYNKDKPLEIYYCIEQKVNYNIDENKRKLKQIDIDNAFLKEYRKTNKHFKIFNHTVYIQHSKYSNRIGINEYDYMDCKVHVSSLERLLVDIIVRPELSGGMKKVLRIYASLSSKYRNIINIQKISQILKELDFIYPYFQSIGYLLEKNNCNVLPLEELSVKKYNFFLTKGKINEKELFFNEKWQVFIPKEYI
jgi:predicted transcriptional regulator of viral defense system